MPQTQKEKLKEEFYDKFSVWDNKWVFATRPKENNTATTEDVYEWFSSRTIPTASLQALVEKIKGMKKTILDFPPLDNGTGDILSANGFNQALSLCKAMVEELLTKENE